MEKTRAKNEIISLGILEADLRARRDNCRVHAERHHEEGDLISEANYKVGAEAFDVALQCLKHLMKTNPPAAGPWRTDEPPQNRPFLGMNHIGKVRTLVQVNGDFWNPDTNLLFARPAKWAEINLPMGQDTLA